MHWDVNFNLPTEFNTATGDGGQIEIWKQTQPGLSEEYELLKAAAATDACYGCRPYRYESSIAGIRSWLVMLG